ncbi:MAG: hypothetical protein QE277_05530 [Flectobacillus sp.]|jgi:hypothetical protein|nr:hypothetical protein [Flectobacillus sp.]
MIRNRAKSLKAAAKARASTDNKDKKRKNKRSRAEIVKKDGRSSKLNNNLLIKELHEGTMPSGKEFLGNDMFLNDDLFHDGGFFGMNDLSKMFLEDSIDLNEGL